MSESTRGASKGDPLKGKRQMLANSMNASLGTFYTADHHDLLSLPEAELDKLIGHYNSFASRHIW